MTALVERLLARLPADAPPADRARLRRAYELAARRHEGRFRKSGDPYITHPVAVAEIAIDAGLDGDTVCAALLHDVVEDADRDVARLREEFGDAVAMLVEGVTRLDDAGDGTPPDAVDDRVLALKAADRLHNMRTLSHLDADKRRRKCRDTLDQVAPAAARLGLREVADELTSIARGHLALLTGRDGAARGTLALGALLLPRAARPRYLDEWLGELDVLRGRRARARFVLGLVLGMPALAVVLRRPAQGRVTAPLLAVLRWVLRTDVRTWGVLAVVLGWAVVELARTSLADALIAVLTVPPVLHAGVARLRARLGVTGEPPG